MPLCPYLPDTVAIFDSTHNSLPCWRWWLHPPGFLPASHTIGLLHGFLLQRSLDSPQDPAWSPFPTDLHSVFLNINLHLYALGSHVSPSPGQIFDSGTWWASGNNHYDNKGDTVTGTVSQSLKQWNDGSGMRAGPLAAHIMLPGLHPKAAGWWKEALWGVKQGWHSIILWLIRQELTPFHWCTWPHFRVPMGEFSSLHISDSSWERSNTVEKVQDGCWGLQERSEKTMQ